MKIAWRGKNVRLAYMRQIVDNSGCRLRRRFLPNHPVGEIGNTRMDTQRIKCLKHVSKKTKRQIS